MKKGFTLVELLVVVAILGVLAAVGIVSFGGYLGKAKENASKTIHINADSYIKTNLMKCVLGKEFIPNRIDDMTIPHIASPDVHVDEKNKKIIMYYHGLEKFGFQQTRVSTSNDGIRFKAHPLIVGKSYFRQFEYKNKKYGMSMPGIFYENFGKTSQYKEITQLFNSKMRHSALIIIKDLLYVFYSQVGDTPERIYLSTIDVSVPVNKWKETKPIEIIRPEYKWEGGDLPLEKSSRSAINIPVNQLRDPAIYKENEMLYLLYSVKGENGIGICTLEIK